MNELRKKHHYVSKSYLKAWSDDRKRISVYRVLVPDDSVKVWDRLSIKNIAYQNHFYTRFSEDGDSDEIERWMDKEIETPAHSALHKIRSGKEITQQDLELLLRFMALQDIRNPVRLMENLKRWQKEVPEVMNRVLQDCVCILESTNKTALPSKIPPPDTDLIPLYVAKDTDPNTKQGFLAAKVIAGQGLWLYFIRHTLTESYKVLNRHHWSILRAPNGIEWFTSDNPVIKLNYYGKGLYDFKGGWRSHGTEILFPLSPYCLLFTKIGSKELCKSISIQTARIIQGFIAENAHRYIFASRPTINIERLRPRVVDRDIFYKEKETWDRWNERKRAMEVNLIKSKRTLNSKKREP